MKLQVNRVLLGKALTALRKVVPRRPSIPTFSNIVLSAADQWLYLLGSDLDTTLRLAIDAEVMDPGQVCTPLADLIGALKAFKTKSITLASHQPTEAPAGAAISADDSDGFRVRVEGWSLLDYPAPSLTPDNGPGGGTHLLDAATFLGALGRVQHACDCGDISRPYLVGVHFRADRDRLVLEAIDGRRLAWEVTDLVPPPWLARQRGGDPVHEIGVTIGARAVRELLALASPEGMVRIGTVALVDGEGGIIFGFGSRLFRAVTLGAKALPSAMYPGLHSFVEEIRPASDQVHTLRIDRERLLNAIQRLLLVDPEHVLLYPVSTEQVLLVGSPGVDPVRLPVEMSERIYPVALNPIYLRDALATLTAPSLEMVMAPPRPSQEEEDRPTSLAPLLIEEGGSLRIVMPMRSDPALLDRAQAFLRDPTGE